MLGQKLSGALERHTLLLSEYHCAQNLQGDFFTWNISNLSSFDVYILDIGFSSRKFPLLATYFGEFRLFPMSNAAEIKILGRSQAEPNVNAVFPIKLSSRNSIVLATSNILKIADAHDEGCRYMFVSTACGYFCAIKVQAFEPNL